MSYVKVVLIGALCSLAITPVFIWLGKRLGILDNLQQPDGFRKIHTRPMPLTGGFAIFLSLIVTFAICCTLLVEHLETARNCLSSSRFLSFVAGSVVILLVGLFDDLYGMRARRKLLLQVMVAVFMYAVGFRIEAVSNPFGPRIDLAALALPVTVFWFIGCMNVINLIDGLDGLAGGVSLFAILTMFVTALYFGNPRAALLTATIAGVLIGFLRYNFHPARIFLGDSGSYLLGFIIATTAMQAAQKTQAGFLILVPLIALGVPLIDTGLAILRRWARKLPLAASDRQHLHHRLRDLGLSHRNAVLAIYLACLALSALALLLVYERNSLAVGFLFAGGGGMFIFTRKLWEIEMDLVLNRLGGDYRHIKVVRDKRVATHIAIEKFKQAQNLKSLWNAFVEAADVLALDQVALSLQATDSDHAGETKLDLVWTHRNAAEPSPSRISLTTEFPIHGTRHPGGTLRIQKHSANLSGENDLPHLLQILVEEMRKHLVRHIPPAAAVATLESESESESESTAGGKPEKRTQRVSPLRVLNAHAHDETAINAF